MYRIFTLLLLLAISIPVLSAPGDDSSTQNELTQKLAKVGVTFTQTGKNIDIIIDEQKALYVLPTLESQGVVSKMDGDAANKAPLSVSVVIIGMSYTISILKSVFNENSSLDKVHVQGYVLPVGSRVKQACYSFDYDRDSFMKLDFNILSPRDFVQNTQGFAFSAWCKTIFDTEATKLK